MTTLDWILAAAALTALIVIAVILGRLNKSVADFLIAGRQVRKYLGMSSGTAEGLGLASIAASLQQGMQHGFALIWVSLILMAYSVPVFGIFGLGIKRFRATRCMTIPEFLEKRYSRRLRVLAGGVLALSGILNMAIFPITGSLFLSAFCGLPDTLAVGPWNFNSVHLVMFALVGLAVLFTFLGGMVTVVVTDYIQATIVVSCLLFVGFSTFIREGGPRIHQVLSDSLGESAFNPFLGGSYGFTWILWVFLLTTANKLAFAPAVQKMASADSPETARKMELLQSLFGIGMRIILLLIGIGALASLGAVPPEGQTAESYFRFAGAVHLRQTLPVGMMGLMFSALLFASISTDDSYLLSWSAIIVNDLIQPILGRELPHRQHIRLLRGVILLIGAFLIAFGLLYDPRESILDYIYLTGTLIGGIGISVYMGLYWSRATTQGACAGLITCVVVPLADLFGKQLIGERYPLSTQQSGVIGILGAVLIMAVVSLLTAKSGPDPRWVDYGKIMRENEAAEAGGADA